VPSEIRLKNIRGPILENHPLAPLTTWRIGGPARFLAVPADLEDVFRLMRLAQDRGWPLFYLGRGSNVLIDDAGLPGLTLHMGRSLQKFAFQEEVVRAGAGVSLPCLARAAANAGVLGFEFLAGIPGTVGAAVRLNAGADGQDLAGVLRRVWVATPQLQILELPAQELQLGYRSSLLLHLPHWLVVEAEFSLAGRADRQTVLSHLRRLLAARRLRQPKNPRTCGSVFKNPPGAPAAGYLIDQAGFKGRRAGDAMVSEKHANFILNQGQATAADIKALVAAVQEAVWRAHHIALEREVVFLPEDLQ
jgi:UDP-N-acetylmuramate dehydrogenase